MIEPNENRNGCQYNRFYRKTRSTIGITSITFKIFNHKYVMNYSESTIQNVNKQIENVITKYPIGLSISGGFDSTVLTFIVLNYITTNKLSTKLSIITVGLMIVLYIQTESLNILMIILN